MEIYRAAEEIMLPSGLVVPRLMTLDFRDNGNAVVALHDRYSYTLRFLMSANMRTGINVASLYLAEEDLLKGDLIQNQIDTNVFVLSIGPVINGIDITQASRMFSPLEIDQLSNYNPTRTGIPHDKH